MGLHTTFLGRITIAPKLDWTDVELLRGYSARTFEQSEPDPFAPAGRSPWMPCDQGCCLHWDGLEKPYGDIAWLIFTIGAMADRHTFDGVIVGERREHRELYAIVVKDNQVTREVLMQGVSDSEAWGDLPLDRERAERTEELERRRLRFEAAIARDRGRGENGDHDRSAT